MIAVDALRFAYQPGGFTLRVPTLHIAAGERVACIGPSGSGKTTLLHLLAGIEAPAAGSVRVDGVDLGALDDAARRAFRLARIGLLFQELELLDYLSARDNVLLPFHLGAGALDAEQRASVASLAAAVGIDALLDRRPQHLSQGERQRVALCRALVTAPSLLLCDEPTGNLDPTTAGTVLDLIFREARARDTTLVLVTHDHSVLPRFDRVLDLAALGATPGAAP